MCEQISFLLMLSYTSIYFETFRNVFVIVCVQDMVPLCGDLQVLLRHIPFLLHVCTGKLNGKFFKLMERFSR